MNVGKAEEKVLAKLSELKSTALHSAVSDGDLSNEEQILINHIEQSLPDLKELTTSIFDDGVIHAQENYLFQEQLRKLLNEAIEISKLDQKVEYGEKIVVQNLRSQMMDLLNYMKELQ